MSEDCPSNHFLGSCATHASSRFGVKLQFLVIGCLTIGGSHLDAQEEASWKIGLASVKITPDFPVRMAGYGSKEREQLSQGVSAELFAKALAVEDRNGNKALMLTTDVIGLTAAVSKPLYQQIAAKAGFKREQILVNSSHTHTGPVVGLDAQSLGYLQDDAHIRATIQYTKTLLSRLVSISVDAVNNLKPARLSWSTGVATFVMNRREFTDRGVRLGVNPRGLVDRSVPVLRVQSPEGKLRCVLFGAACHNTTLGGTAMRISGDFAGYAQEYVERELDGIQAMFLQGCAGDANPFPRGSEEIARIHGMTLGKEVLRVLSSEFAKIDGPLTTLSSSVQLPLQQNLSDNDYDKLERASGSTRSVAQKLREKLKSDGNLPGSFQTECALWQFGEDLTLVALPGEVVVEYVRLIEDALGPRKLWVSAYNHDVFGYLPTARVLREGGYEIRGIYSGGLGIFAPNVEDVVVERIQALAKQARQTP